MIRGSTRVAYFRRRSRELPQRDIPSEPRGHLRCFYDVGKCTSSIPRYVSCGRSNAGYLSRRGKWHEGERARTCETERTRGSGHVHSTKDGVRRRDCCCCCWERQHVRKNFRGITRPSPTFYSRIDRVPGISLPTSATKVDPRVLTRTRDTWYVVALSAYRRARDTARAKMRIARRVCSPSLSLVVRSRERPPVYANRILIWIRGPLILRRRFCE